MPRVSILRSLQDVLVLGGEVFTDHGNHANIGEIAGGQRKIGRRAAERVFHAARRRSDGIKGDGTDGEYAHE